MKRFIVSVLSVAVFFIGLGGLFERVGARFKSDDRALEIIRQTRVAVGGEDAIRSVKSLTMTARTAQTFNFDGAARVEQGDVEISLQLPNQFARTIKFIKEDGNSAAGEKIVNENFLIIKKNGNSDASAGDGASRKFSILKKGASGNEDVSREIENADGVRKVIIDKDLRVGGAGEVGYRQNELFRTTFALLLSAPEGLDVNYTYAGEATVDGTDCDIVQAQAAGDASPVKLFIGKSSRLPVMMSYRAMKPLVIKINRDNAAASGAPERDVKVFRQSIEKSAAETAEYQVKFSDYRTVGSLQLPFKWTQTANNQVDNVLDVSNYEINPANIAEKFQKPVQRVLVKREKPQ